MDHHQLVYDLKHTPSITLLKRDNAPLIISFLHRAFKRDQVVSIALDELTARLDGYLEALNEVQVLYPLSAAAYLKQWSDEDHQIVRIVARGDTSTVELTAEAERVIGWVEEMYRREFVGTESRLRSIRQLVEEIVTRSTEDVEARLTQLERERDAIQQEIDTIRATGQVIPYTSTQVRERFLQASETARQMTRDFAALEQNFRGIARAVQERQLEPGARRGDVLGYVLDADAALRESDQGRSFYAFWELLMSPTQQDELARLLDTLYQLPMLEDLAPNHVLLRRLSRSLIEAGNKIVQSNHRLADQVRRLLDDRALAESRRARELIASIKQHALRYANQPPDNAAFLLLEGAPDVQLVMEKPLWEARVTVAVNTEAIEVGRVDLHDPSLRVLYQQFTVDEARLLRRIETLLETRPACTLGEVLAHYPAEQGLAEIIAYLAIAAGDVRHVLSEATSEEVELPAIADGAAPRVLSVPRVVFRSAYAS